MLIMVPVWIVKMIVGCVIWILAMNALITSTSPICQNVLIIVHKDTTKTKQYVLYALKTV